MEIILKFRIKLKMINYHREKGAVVRDSIGFNDTIIHSNSTINKTIIDKNVEIRENCQIGIGDNYEENKDKPDLLVNGLNIIAKGATISKETLIERNCRIFPM